MTNLTFAELQSKASFSNIVTEEQVIKRYKGLAIVESAKGFNSEEEIDEYTRLAVAHLTK